MLFPSNYNETQQINEKRVVITSWLRVDKAVFSDFDFAKMQKELACEKLSSGKIDSTHPGISRECLVSCLDESVSNPYGFNYVARWSYKNSGHIDEAMLDDIAQDSDDITNFVVKTITELQNEAYKKIDQREKEKISEAWKKDLATPKVPIAIIF